MMQRVLQAICLSLLSWPTVLVAQEIELAKSLMTIRMEVVATMADSIGDWVDRSVVVDSRGRYYQGQGHMKGDGGHIFVFDAHGKFLERFGGIGRGPGEYPTGITALLVGPRDTLYAFDGLTYTVLAPTTHAYVRKVLHPWIMHVPPVVIGPSRFVALVRDSVPLPNGLPREGLAIFTDTNPASMRRFGFPAKNITWRRQPCVSETGILWSLTAPDNPHPRDYQLEAWDTLGRRQQVLVRRPSWGQASKGGGISCDVDEEGRIWVFKQLLRGGDTVATIVGKIPHHVGSYFLMPGAFVTQVEVIDPRRKLVIASQEFPEGLSTGVGNHLVYTRREDDEIGEASIAILRFRLAESSKRAK